MSNSRQTPRTFKPIAVASGVLVLLLAALPTTTVLVIGMAPTLGAFIGDKTPGRYLTKCVAGINFAGVFPFLYQLWMTNNTMSGALSMVTNMYTWLAMYSAAAMGWLLFLGLPGAVAMFRSLNAQRRIYVLQEKQKDLINEWGESILSTIDKPRGDTKGGNGATVESSESGADGVRTPV